MEQETQIGAGLIHSFAVTHAMAHYQGGYTSVLTSG